MILRNCREMLDLSTGQTHRVCQPEAIWSTTHSSTRSEKSWRMARVPLNSSSGASDFK
uniref:Uncharacterized protein n=1 Tax=Mesocestoides corti TaxID=53468 RepID=A0A5K3F0I9_MESCO